MRAESLQIESAGIVRMAANGKLELSGSGKPLRGGGALDTRTNTPNSVEYTGQATNDLLGANMIGGFSGSAILDRSRLASELQLGQTKDPIQPFTFGRVGSITFNAGEDLV